MSFTTDLKVGGTEAEGWHSDLFPFGRSGGKRRVGCECLVVRIVKERRIVTRVPM